MVEVKDGYAWSYARNSVKKSRLQKRCAKIESFFFLFLEKRMFVDEKYFIFIITLRQDLIFFVQSLVRQLKNGIDKW